MIYDGKDFRVAFRMVVPRGFDNWTQKEKLRYFEDNMKNPIIILSVNEITERRKDGRLH